MSWLNKQQKSLFRQVLEPNPPLNKKGGIRLLPLSNYYSEMKGLGQTIQTINRVRSTGELPGQPKEEGKVDSSQRYWNALTNVGLMEDEKPVLTSVATEVLEYLDNQGANIDQLSNKNNTDLLSKIEHIMLERNIEALLRDPSSSKRNITTLKTLLRSIQLFVDEVPSDGLHSIINQIDDLTIYQGIHSVGYEIARLFRLEADKRDSFISEWREAEKTFAQGAPTSYTEEVAALYIGPWAKNVYQSDIRFRIQYTLKAYLSLRDELEDRFPIVGTQLQVLNYRVSKKPIVASSGARPKVDHPHQRIISGCPGSGKSFKLQQEIRESGAQDFEVERVLFHPDYTYHDFVGAYKPVPLYESTSSTIRNGSGDTLPQEKPVIDYQFVPGPFARALRKAFESPHRNIFLITEEINRAKASAVFGDLLQLLERDNDGQSAYGVAIASEFYGFLKDHLQSHELRIPPNLFIWATMNAADQGVFPLDSAFRRRWEFEYLGFNEDCRYDPMPEVTYGGDTLPWDEFRRHLNKALLEANVHEDKLIGPYFLKPYEITDPNAVLNKVFLYLWDDVLRHRRDVLLTTNSFAEFGKAWNNGAGAPLDLDLKN